MDTASQNAEKIEKQTESNEFQIELDYSELFNEPITSLEHALDILNAKASKYLVSS